MSNQIYPKEIIPYLHKPDQCIGENCVIHNASDHHMNDWPIIIRVDREFGLAERRCPHGTGHPDPDSLSFIALRVKQLQEEEPELYRSWKKYKGKPYGPFASDVHGCDGCCSGAYR